MFRYGFASKKTFTRCLWLIAVSVFAHRPSQPFVLSIFMKNISCQENKHSLKWLWTRSGMGTASEWENRRLARLFLTAFLAEVVGGARIKINSRLQLLTGLPLWVRRHSLPSILELLFSISPWPPSPHSSIPAVPRPPTPTRSRRLTNVCVCEQRLSPPPPRVKQQSDPDNDTSITMCGSRRLNQPLLKWLSMTGDFRICCQHSEWLHEMALQRINGRDFLS